MKRAWPLVLMGLMVVSLVLWALTFSSSVYRPVAAGNAQTLGNQDVFKAERLRELALASSVRIRLLAPVAEIELPRLELPTRQEASQPNRGQPNTIQMQPNTQVTYILRSARRPPTRIASASSGSAVSDVNSSDAAALDSAADTTEPALAAPGSLRLLIVQTSQQQLDQGQASSVVLLHLDPVNQRTQIVPLPTNLQVERPDSAESGTNRTALAQTYTEGGLPLTLRSVEQLTGRPVDVYVELSRGGLGSLVAALGNVTLKIPQAVRGELQVYPKGEQTLNSAQAMDYLAGRQQSQSGPDGRSPDGSSTDVGRVSRTQHLMDAMAARISGQNPSVLFLALPGMRGMVRTNLTPGELLRWKSDYPFLFTSQRQVLDVNAQASTINGTPQTLVSDAERVRLYRELK